MHQKTRPAFYCLQGEGGKIICVFESCFKIPGEKCNLNILKAKKSLAKERKLKMKTRKV